jgi:hypothetical protein
MEERIKTMLPLLDEKQRRLFLANEALAYGRSGTAIARRVSGVSKNTIKRGIRERLEGMDRGVGVRASGGGRRLIEKEHPEAVDKILEIVNAATYGNPEKVLSYTTESLRKPAGQLGKKGIAMS